ncbi:MAG: flavohemoglobin expression-modulating QEGLA motif protein [Leucothrix sp.]
MSLEKEQQRIRNISDLLYQASRSLRILSHLSWDASVKQQFFASGAKELPVVAYEAFDATETLSIVEAVRTKLSTDSPIDRWLLGIAHDFENTAQLLHSTNTPDFYRYSCELYGTPASPLIDQTNTSLGLANQLSDLFASFDSIDLGEPDVAGIGANTVAAAMRKATYSMFADAAPDVNVVDTLSANALAGSKQIRIRRGAKFTDKDIQQLINHEAFVHVATSLNGRHQDDLKILAASYSGTTRTQEGLAVFAEFITGSMDIDRMHRLADRVIAIQMAVDGADFLQVYQYFLDRIGEPDQSFENTRRVFRGGLLTGGAPFTKDIVYLDGLLRVHNFMRSMVATKRTDVLRMLFCGKLDLEDIPVLCELSSMGLCKPAKYLPPWASDLRFLLAYLTYSSFLNKIDLSQVNTHYQQLLEDAPVVKLS